MKYNTTVVDQYLNRVASIADSMRGNITKLKSEILNFEKSGKWSGTRARTSILNLKKTYNNNVEVYNALVNQFNNISYENSYLKREAAVVAKKQAALDTSRNKVNQLSVNAKNTNK